MFLTSNYICFYSKILNHENILILKLTHVNSIVKTMHALIFPTAIRIQTKNSTYAFTSFRSRGNTLDHLHNLLQKSRQVMQIEIFLIWSNFRLFSETNWSTEQAKYKRKFKFKHKYHRLWWRKKSTRNKQDRAI